MQHIHVCTNALASVQIIYQPFPDNSFPHNNWRHVFWSIIMFIWDTPHLRQFIILNLYFPNLFTIRLAFLPYFPYLFTIQLTFLPYFPYLFNIQLTFLLYFPNLFTIQLTFLPYFPYHFTIQPTFLPHFPYLVTIQLGFLPYFSYLFTIQLTFLPYFPYLFTIQLTFSSVFSKSFHYPNCFSSFLTHPLTQLTQWYSQHKKVLKFSCDLNLFQRIPIALKYIVFSSYLKRVLGNVFQLSETSINSYDISFMYKLLWYSCNIVECGNKHHKPNPLFTKTYTYLPIYLHFYQNYRFY